MKEDVLKALAELLAGQPSRLDALAESYKTQGRTQEEVYQVFLDVWSEKVMVDGQPVVPKDVEDAFFGVLERISGFCSEHQRIWV